MSSHKAFQCLICASALHKDEVRFVDDNTFPFLSRPPAGLATGSYCLACFDAQVGPELERHHLKMEQAKNVNVFYASQSKESRFIRRTEKLIRVENCQDPQEVILHLAFLAAQADKNTLVDVDLKSVKVRNGSWQSSLWSGQAIPADIDERSLNRRFPGAPN
jgi:hypothetical protein